MPPREFIEEERPSSVRVTTIDGNRLVLDQPTIENDSIVFRSVEEVAREGFIRRSVGSERLSIALAAVSAIEEARSNT